MIITQAKIERHAARAIGQHVRLGMTERALRAWDTAFCMEAIAPKSGMNILEVGSGATHTYLAFHDTGATVAVTDSMHWQERRERELDAKKQVQLGLPDINIQQAEANAAGIKSYKLDIQIAEDCPENDAYDAVYSISALEHADLIEAALGNIYRILKPGGVFAVTTECNFVHSLPWVGAELFIRIFNVVEFVELLMDAGFTVHDISPEPEHLPRMYGGADSQGLQMLSGDHFGNVGFICTKREVVA